MSPKALSVFCFFLLKFKETISIYKCGTKIYTNVSITEDNVGIAIIYDEEVFMYKIIFSNFIFSTEPFEIYKTLKAALEKESLDFTIFSDSWSALIGLKNACNLLNKPKGIQKTNKEAKHVTFSSEY